MCDKNCDSGISTLLMVSIFLKLIMCPLLLQLKVFDSVEPQTLKTREMERLIAGMGDSKKVLFVDDAEVVNEPLCRATGNLHYINVIPAKVSSIVGFGRYSERCSLLCRPRA